MKTRLHILLLLSLALVLTGISTPSAAKCPYPSGCSALNTITCIYFYDFNTGCCVTSNPWLCPKICC